MQPSKWITQVYWGPVHAQRPDKGMGTPGAGLQVFGDLLLVFVQTLGFEL